MVSKKKRTSKGYGARYGPKVRDKFSKLRDQQRSTYECPYCGYEKVKRVSLGIWHCRKCDSKFTNKAYKVGELEPVKKVIYEGESVE